MCKVYIALVGFWRSLFMPCWLVINSIYDRQVFNQKHSFIASTWTCIVCPKFIYMYCFSLQSSSTKTTQSHRGPKTITAKVSARPEHGQHLGQSTLGGATLAPPMSSVIVERHHPITQVRTCNGYPFWKNDQIQSWGWYGSCCPIAYVGLCKLLRNYSIIHVYA